MTEYACQYVVARFLRNPIRDEAKNVGIILQCPAGRYISGRFDDDLGRLSASSHDHIIINSYSEWLTKLSRQSDGTASLFTERELDPGFLPRLAAASYGNIQFTEPRGCVTDDPQKMLDELYEMLVTPDDPSEGDVDLAEKNKTFPAEFYAYLKNSSPEAAPYVKSNVRVSIEEQKLSFDYGYERSGNRGYVLYETVDFSKGTFSTRIKVASPTIVKFGLIRARFARDRYKTYAVVKPLSNGSTGRDHEEMDLLRNSSDDVFSFIDPVQMENLAFALTQDFALRP